MTAKADFDAETWELIVAAPFCAGVVVATAERGGTLREGVAVAQAYLDARGRRGSSALLDEIVSSPAPVRLEGERSPDEVRRSCLERLRTAADAVAAKATSEDLEEYRSFVLDVAERVAAAHKEGGFLGIGGTPVSEAERRAVEDVRAALGAEAGGMAGAE